MASQTGKILFPLQNNTMLKFKSLFLFLFFISLSHGLYCQVIECTADNVYSEFSDTGDILKTTFEGNVTITYRDIVITCEKAVIDHTKNLITIESQLKFSQKGFSLSANQLLYDIDKETGKFIDSRFSYKPFFGSSKVVEKDKDKIFADTCILTTCDRENPHYHLLCGRIQLTEEKISIKNLKLYFGNIPVFYIPAFSYNLITKKPIFMVSAGYKTEIGNGISLIFNNTSKSKKIDMEERIDIGTEGLGAGLVLQDSTLPDTTSAIKKFQAYGFKKYGNYKAAYGFTGEFQQEFDYGQNVILDWRWMKNEEFFRKHLYDQYLEKSKNPNYFSYSKILGQGLVNVRVDEWAQENFLSPSRIPEIEFSMPYINIGNLFGSFNIVPTRFVDNKGDEYSRIVADIGIEKPFSKFSTKITPFIRIRNVFYTGQIEEINNFIFTPGINFQWLAMSDKKDGNVIYFSPSFAIFTNFPTKKVVPFSQDYYDSNPDSTFASLNLSWDFWHRQTKTGNITMMNLYDTGKNLFSDSVILWNFSSGKKWFFQGQERFNFSKGGIREQLNTITFKRNTLQVGFGNRYLSGYFDGVTAFFNKRKGDWEFGGAIDYDMQSDKFTSQRYYIQKNFHCLTIGIVYSKTSTTSIGLFIVPSAFAGSRF